jgi:ADP-heptose:LPS heptosyltransferase
MKRVLIVKFWAIGDVVMTTPLLTSLRARYPDVHITWAISRENAELLRGHSEIDRLWEVDVIQWRKPLRRGNLLSWLARSVPVHKQAREYGFDAVINCHPEKWWTYPLCAAPVRVALVPGNQVPGFVRRLYTHIATRPPNVHNIRHYLEATRVLGCPIDDVRLTLGETEDEAPFWQAFVERHGLDINRPIVLLAPFSNGANREWELERWGQLAQKLVRECNAQIVLPASSHDKERADTLVASSPVAIVRADQTTLRQYIALIRHASLVVGLDSSAMHIAGATNTPFVALFGATPVNQRAPIVGRILPVANLDGLPCAPCDTSGCIQPEFAQCMKQIGVETAFTAAQQLLTR